MTRHASPFASRSRRLLLTAAALTLAAGPAGVASAAEAPYDLAKFQPVLNDSKLQAPKSSPAMIERGDFAGASNEYFHLDGSGERLVFTATGDSSRSELRQLTGDWDTATAVEQALIARVKVLVPETPELEQFTFLQIHDKQTDDNGGLNKPLIRLTWRKSRSKMKDHLWAGIRTPDDPTRPISLENLASEWIDLGPRPEGFFDAAIRVRDNRMRVTIDGEEKIDMDITYWAGLENYFKAGVYNQDPGTSVAIFEELRYASGDEDAPAAPAEPR